MLTPDKTHVHALFAAALFALVALFQIALALGAPWGAASWGGRVKGVLPRNLRIGSAISAVVLSGSAFVVLGRAGSGPLGEWPETVLQIGCWVLAGMLALSTLGNLASKSRVERAVMTPLALATLFFVVLVALGSR